MNQPTSLGRRDVLKAGVAGAGLSALAGCSTKLKGSGTSNSKTIRIGYVSPRTGPLASFAAADNFVLKEIRDALRKGVKVGGSTRGVKIVVKDSQSSSTRAAEVARSLIFSDKVDMILTSSTPDTTNPVADQCEANGMPCVSTIAPWEAWYFGRGAKAGKAFTYTTMFFFGMAQFTELFVNLWNRVGTDKKVGTLWPNDTDANAFREAFPSAMQKAGYSMVDAGAYQDGISDFSAPIATFKRGGAELFTTTPLPPDFNTFWRQAAQQGYRPRLATVAKVLLFPSEAEALGSLVNNVAVGGWWTPTFPYRSTLTGMTAKQLADAFTRDTGKQWTQALGSIYALFEIAKEAFSSVDDPHDRRAVAHALTTMKIEGMCGPLDFAHGPVPGVAVQKVAGVQWRKGKDFPWDLYVVDNSTFPDVPLAGDLQPTTA